LRVCPHCEQKTTEKLCPTDGYQTVDAAAYESSDVDPFLGKEFEGRYRIEKMLGEGGFGAVYKATQLAVNRSVALKIMKSELATDLKEVARFQQEARALASLKNPHIVTLIDFGQADGGHLYLVMDFCDGMPLNAALKAKGRMKAERVVDLGLQMLDGLAEAHALGIVHRDLKPENLFLVKDRRGNEKVRILDFGIAKVSGDAAANVTLTAAGVAIGSPRYMSPEQARGKPVTACTDLYSLGVILYEMLTGRSVFRCETATDYLMAHVRDAPPMPVIDGAEVGGPLVEFIIRCLQKDANDRPVNADEAARLLKACVGGPLDPSRSLPGPPEGSVTGHDATAYADISGIEEATAHLDASEERPAAPATSSGPSAPMRHPSESKMSAAEASAKTAYAPSASGPGISSGKLPQVSHDPTGRADHIHMSTGHGPSLASHMYPTPPAGNSTAIIVASVALVVAALIVAGALMWTSGGDEEDGKKSGLAATEYASVEREAGGSVASEASTDEAKVASKPADKAEDKAADKAKDEAKDKAGDKAKQEPKAEVPKKPAMRTVQLDSEPSGASVKIGRKTIGTTPMEVSWGPDERPPKLLLKRRAGGKRYMKRLTLKAADAGTTKTVTLTLTLQKKSTSAGSTGGGRANSYEVID